MQRTLLILCLGLCPAVLAGQRCADELVQAHKIKYLAAVRRQLQTPPLRFDNWSCNEGSCSLLVPTLMTALHLYEELPLISQVTNHALSHTFLRDASLGVDDAIIVDPTYQQFFRGAEALDLPCIFVGTRADLITLFTTYRDRIRYNDLAEYPPEELVDRLYGFGRFEAEMEISRDTI